MKHIDFKTKGTCSQQISFDLDDGKVKNIKFYGGCAGNLQGISILCENMPASELVAKLSGVKCGFKPTSCPDQLAAAVKQAAQM